MKLLFGLIIGTAIAVIVVALYCALIIAGRSDEQIEKDDSGFSEKQLCPKCKTGKYTYDLDPKSETCPYIGCLKWNKCPFYKPLEKSSKLDRIRRNNKTR